MISSYNQVTPKLWTNFRKLVNHDFQILLKSDGIALQIRVQNLNQESWEVTGMTVIIWNCAQKFLDYWRGHPKLYPKFTCSRGLEGGTLIKGNYGSPNRIKFLKKGKKKGFSTSLGCPLGRAPAGSPRAQWSYATDYKFHFNLFLFIIIFHRSQCKASILI